MKLVMSSKNKCKPPKPNLSII